MKTFITTSFLLMIFSLNILSQEAPQAEKYTNTLNVGLRKSNGVYHFSGGRNYFDGWSGKEYVRFQEWKPKEQYFGRAQYIRKIGLFDLTLKTEFFKENW